VIDKIIFIALKVSKISYQDLQGLEYFADVFQRFVDWTENVITRCNRINEKLYFPG